MANEITFSFNLSVIEQTNSFLDKRYQNNWQADLATSKGPSIGAQTISVAGEDIDLSELTTPGIAIIKNLDKANFVEIGINAPTDGFVPLAELLPGEEYVIRFSRNLGTLHMRANTAQVVVGLDVFQA